MQSQHTHQARWANHNQNPFHEMQMRLGQQQYVNHKAKELVAKSLAAYHNASELAQSVEAMTARMQINESSDLDRHKADFDALMAWTIEEKPAFVTMLTSLGDELPPKMAAALERLYLYAPYSRQLYEAEQKIQSLEADARAGKEEVESARKLAEAEAQDWEPLQERLSTANSTIDSLKKDLAKAKAESARQAEELVQEKETSRKHEQKVIELLDELADLEEMSKER